MSHYFKVLLDTNVFAFSKGCKTIRDRAPLRGKVYLCSEKHGTFAEYLSDMIWHAVGRGDPTTETDDDKICEEHALFEGESYVFLKGTVFPLVRGLGEVHPKDSSRIGSTTDQPYPASKF